MVNENEEKNERKIFLAWKNNIKLHITLSDNSWRNGYVFDMSADFFFFEDKVNGREPIFFLDLKRVEPYNEQDKEERREEDGQES